MKNPYRQTAQAFAVLLPIQSVGVMGDGRTYESVVAIRAVQTEDYMTADWAHLPYELLARISTRIINEVKGVNRVVYELPFTPPGPDEEDFSPSKVPTSTSTRLPICTWASAKQLGGKTVRFNVRMISVAHAAWNDSQ